MLIFEKNSLFIIKGEVSLSSLQEETLTKCYLPIISSMAFCLYHIFVYTNKDNRYFSYEYLQIYEDNDVTINNAIHYLEATGLLSTYRKESQNKVVYILKIFKPSTPYNFFNNPILSNLLLSKIGERRFLEVRNYFKSFDDIPKEFIDVSADYRQVFDVDSSLDKIAKINGLIDEEQKDVKYSFDESKFNKKLLELQVDPEVLKPYKEQIKKLASLYGVNEEDCATYISQFCLNSYNVFEFDSFSNWVMKYRKFAINNQEKGQTYVFGTSDFAKRVKEMEEKKPNEFLSSLYKGATPSIIQLRLIKNLSLTYKLSTDVINCILDYTFQKCEGKIPENYAVSIALTLISHQINNAYDAMSYLYASDQKTSQKIKEKNSLYVNDSAKNNFNNNNDNKEKNDDQITEDNYDDLFKGEF